MQNCRGRLLAVARALFALVWFAPQAAHGVGVVVQGEVSAPSQTGTTRSVYSFSNDGTVRNSSSGNYTLNVADDGKSVDAEVTVFNSGGADSAQSRARANLAKAPIIDQLSKLIVSVVYPEASGFSMYAARSSSLK